MFYMLSLNSIQENKFLANQNSVLKFYRLNRRYPFLVNFFFITFWFLDASVYLKNHENIYFANKTSKEITGHLTYINTNLMVNKNSLCYDVWRVLILDTDGFWTRISDHDLLLGSLVPFRLFVSPIFSVLLLFI